SEALRLGKIGRPRRFGGVLEARPIEDHLLLFATGQVRETDGRRGAPKSVEAVAIDAGEADIGLAQFLAAHTLDRITPDAIHPSDELNNRTPTPIPRCRA